MQFTIQREQLLKPLQRVIGAIEKRQTLPILSNVLLNFRSHQLIITATDLEIELTAQTVLSKPAESGSFTVSGRKLMDICRAMPAEADLTIHVADQKMKVTSQKSRFVLATLPVEDFPKVETAAGMAEFTVKQKNIKQLIDSTQFSMAQQDVRYYLNGMLLEIDSNELRAVATDGHRLAMSMLSEKLVDQKTQVILPRKGVMELSRLLSDEDEKTLTITITGNHFRANSDDFNFVSKLVEGRFPDYEKVIPKECSKKITVDRNALKEVLSRVAILSNEKNHGVKLQLSSDQLSLMAHGSEHDLAEESMKIDYSGESLEIGFNVTYLLDVLNALPAGQVQISVSDPNNSMLIESLVNAHSVYVIMPMRL